MTTPLDEHGQPVNRGFNAWSIYRRSIDEMLGLCKGVILDGHVTDSEAVALDEWLAAHPEVARTWPGNILAQRLRTIFANAIVEEDERADLKDLLEKITGPDSDFTTVGGQSTTLPLDEPPPTNYAFCFTGRFVRGEVCQGEVLCRRQEPPWR